MTSSAPARFPVRVYYEDTDCMGVVYHASYLRFLERGRTELFAALGSAVWDWLARGVMFPLYTMNLAFKAPARLGDEIEVVTRARRVSPFRVRFEQRIERKRDGRLLV